jgi:hypothetical protein
MPTDAAFGGPIQVPRCLRRGQSDAMFLRQRYELKNFRSHVKTSRAC